MNWFIAKLVFRIYMQRETQGIQFDEQLRLISGHTKAEVLLKARTIGKNQQEIIAGNNGEKIQWQFIDVADIQPLPLLEHGIEIYSTTHIDEDPDDYINFIRLKGNSFHKPEPVL